MTRRELLASVLVIAAGLTGCGGGPPEIAWNSETCDFCRMTISERRFAAAATTATGRTVRFDAIECLAGWVLAQPQGPRAIWVTDAERPGTLIPVDNARFFRLASGHSPMGKGFIAVAATRDLPLMAAKYGEGPLTWDQIRVIVRREGATPAHSAGSN